MPQQKRPVIFLKQTCRKLHCHLTNIGPLIHPRKKVGAASISEVAIAAALARLGSSKLGSYSVVAAIVEISASLPSRRRHDRPN